nr:neurocan core protein-like [Lytechinus pictus]
MENIKGDVFEHCLDQDGKDNEEEEIPEYLEVEWKSSVLGGGTCESIPQSACPYTMSTRTGRLMQFVPKYLTRDHPDYDAMVPKEARDKIKLYCAHPDCYSNPCNNGGTCTETFDGHTCSCIGEYAGIHCENPICPSEWIYATRKCFKIVDPSASVVMQDAVDFCNNMGFVTLGNGHQVEPSLVFVENSTEYNLLESYVEASRMWLNCRKIDGTFFCYKDRHLTTSNYRNDKRKDA